MTPLKLPPLINITVFLFQLLYLENLKLYNHCAPTTQPSPPSPSPASFSLTFELQPLRTCASDCQCTKAYGKEARCIGGKCYCLSGVLGGVQKLQNESSTLTTTTVTSMIAQDCFRLAESRASSFYSSSSSTGNSSSLGVNAWSELVSSQREAERYRITWAAVFIFILCAIAAIFHVYQAD